MLPSGQVFAVEQLLPFIGIAFASIFLGSEGKNYQVQQAVKYSTVNRFSIGESPEDVLPRFMGQTNLLAPAAGINAEGNVSRVGLQPTLEKHLSDRLRRFSLTLRMSS